MPTEKEQELLRRLHWCAEDLRTGTQANTEGELYSIIREIVRLELLESFVTTGELLHLQNSLEARILALESDTCSCCGVQK